MGALTRAVRNISRRKMRALLVIIALGFSIAIMISLPSGVEANQGSAQRLSADYTTTINNMQAAIAQTETLIEISNSSSTSTSPYAGFAFRSGFGASGILLNDEESLVSSINPIQGVAAVIPILSAPGTETMQNFSGFGGRTFTIYRPKYTIDGVPLNSSLIDNYPVLPTNITEGRNLQQGDAGVVLLSLNNTQYFGVGVGGTVNIFGSNFTVVGVYSPAETGETGFGQALTLYMNIADAQRITNNEGNVSILDVYAENTSAVNSVAPAITNMYPELSVSTYADREAQFTNLQSTYQSALQNAESTLNNTQSIAIEEIILVIAATSLIVLFVMLYTVRERTKEIGTLKAIGFSNWNVMSQFMLEGILLSIIAGLVGIAIASVGAPTLASILLPAASRTSAFRYFGGPGVTVSRAATFSLDPRLILLAFGGAVVLGALGSLYPSWRASRTSPMEALRYE